MDLTKEQDIILNELFSFSKKNVYRRHNFKAPYVTVGGYAGTGKTTLISYFRKKLEELSKELPVAFCCFTGKASSVLNSKLENNDCIYEQDYIGTIHGLIYRPEFGVDKDKQKIVIKKWVKKTELGVELIIVDEASMVNKIMFDDLLSYKKPIIAIGDHGQLPPVESTGFNLMSDPDFKLETIMRQSQNNPILRLATMARTEGRIPFGTFGKHVFKMKWDDSGCKDKFDSIKHGEDTIVLTGYNRTRAYLNQRIRILNKLDIPDPYPGERVICLKNNKLTKVMNGQIGTIEWLVPEDDKLYRLTVKLDGIEEPYSNLVHNACFGKERYDAIHEEFQKLEKQPKKKYKMFQKPIYTNYDYFDFGYAITVHKSQGSEWDRVVLFEEQFMDREDYKKWLYTGITRAKERLFLISM